MKLVLTRTSVCERAVLIAPYALGRWGTELVTEMRDVCQEKMASDPSSIIIVHSRDDAWPAPQWLIETAMQNSTRSVTELPGKTHEEVVATVARHWVCEAQGNVQKNRLEGGQRQNGLGGFPKS